MKRKVVTLSGMSTSGKSTLADKLEEIGGFKEVPSFTTRPQRPGEIDGVDYYFIDHETARNIIDNNEALQYVEINDNYYGSDKKDFDKVYEDKKIPMLVCDPNGPKALEANKDLMNWDVLPVFIDAKPETLANRILERMVGEQEYINELNVMEPERAEEYDIKYRKEYSKRIKNMSDLEADEIDDVFDKVGSYIENNNPVLKEDAFQKLRDGFASEDSIEAKWKSDHKYFMVVHAEDLEKDFTKEAMKIQKKIDSLDKKPTNDFNCR